MENEGTVVGSALLAGRMNAITHDRFGGPEVLRMSRIEIPSPSAGQVLIRVVAASLNMYDVHMTSGLPLLARTVAGWRHPRYPVPGSDVAGEVVAVGPDVTDFELGDAVFGVIGAGAFAEYAVAKVGAIARKPESVSFEAAAAAPLAGLTALQGLRDVGRLEAGQRVVVNGASGGVGHLAVQVAKALGAEVAAVCSTTKVDLAHSIGADRVVDYRRSDFTAELRDYDLLFDNVGDRPWSETSRVLAEGGRNVTITGPKRAIIGPMRSFIVRKLAAGLSSKSFTWFTAHTNRTDLESLASQLDLGTLDPVIEATYPIAGVPDAMAYLAEGHARAKLVVIVR
jgi:NADPH:quinone reductase-like Zn-dependent oxidoreductase